jgi:hypothetical protein
MPEDQRSGAGTRRGDATGEQHGLGRLQANLDARKIHLTMD